MGAPSSREQGTQGEVSVLGLTLGWTTLRSLEHLLPASSSQVTGLCFIPGWGPNEDSDPQRCVGEQKLRDRWEGPRELIVIIKLGSHDHSNMCLPLTSKPLEWHPIGHTPELKAFAD